MKKVILIFIAAWFVFCSSKMKEEYIDISDQCIFNVNIGNACFRIPHGSTNDEIIIKNKFDYQDFMDSNRNRNTQCFNAKIPYIDFSRYILIGKRTSGTCRASYNYSVSIDTKSRKIKYTIDVDYTGSCRVMVSSWNWACIPKYLDYDSIHFEVE